jgi:hypothetical protein
MKKVLLFCMIILSANLIHAQEKEKKIKRSDCKHHIGLTGGFSTGYGISYLYQVKKIGIQTTFSPYYDEHTHFTNISLTGLYLLHKGKNINMMLYLSNSLTFRNYKYIDEYSNIHNEKINNLSGVGLAYQMYMSQKCKICFYTGYMFRYYEYHSGVDLSSSYQFKKNFGLYPDGGVSLYFMF